MSSKWSGKIRFIPTFHGKLKLMVRYSTTPRNKVLFGGVSKKWYGYLKKNHLYGTYVSRIYETIQNGCDAHYLLAISSYAQIEGICKHIDEHISGNCTYKWWQNKYYEFKNEIDAPLNHHKNCAKLYRVNVPKIQHSKYIGSSELRKSLYDRAVDGFFKLFTKWNIRKHT